MVKRDDQLFAFYAMETVGEWKGVAGLFISGIFGAALSSLSVVLNSTAAVLLEDILKGCFKKNPSERASAIFVKGSILVLGAATMGFLFVVEKLGGILGVATSLTAIAAGTTFGIFSLGMLNPYATSTGAITGAICGALLSGWVSLGSQVAAASGQVVPPKKPISMEYCPLENSTLITPGYDDNSEEVFPLYRLSYHWINPIGLFTVFIVGTVVSFITGPNRINQVDPELISPVIHSFLPDDCFTNYGMASKSKRAKENVELNVNHLYDEDER
jgi:Na+/proline symporter